jgi:hypothetical protein
VPYAVRALWRLPGPGLKLAAGVGLVAAPVLLYLVWPPLGLLAGLAVLVAFTPGGWGRISRR